MKYPNSWLPPTDLGTIFPMTAKTTVKGVGDARDEHNGENDDVIKKG